MFQNKDVLHEDIYQLEQQRWRREEPLGEKLHNQEQNRCWLGSAGAFRNAAASAPLEPRRFEASARSTFPHQRVVGVGTGPPENQAGAKQPIKLNCDWLQSGSRKSPPGTEEPRDQMENG